MRWVIVTFILLLSAPAFASTPAGSIGEMKGSGAIERGKDVISGNDGVNVEMQDTAVTANGTMRIDFIDEILS